MSGLHVTRQTLLLQGSIKVPVDGISQGVLYGYELPASDLDARLVGTVRDDAKDANTALFDVTARIEKPWEVVEVRTTNTEAHFILLVPSGGGDRCAHLKSLSHSLSLSLSLAQGISFEYARISVAGELRFGSADRRGDPEIFARVQMAGDMDIAPTVQGAPLIPGVKAEARGEWDFEFANYGAEQVKHR